MPSRRAWAFCPPNTADRTDKMRLWGFVGVCRFVRRIFPQGGVAPYVAEVFSAVALKTSCSPPLAELGRCHSACRVFCFPQRFSGKCQGAARRQARFPLTSSENAAFFGALTLRLCVPHFSTGRLSPYVVVHNPIEDLGRCHSACRDFRFHKSFPGIAKELPAARRGSPTNAPCLRHKPAYAGRCGGNSRSLRSLKCGREPDGSPHKRPPP